VRLLQELAMDLCSSGRFEEALATAQEAEALGQRLRFGMAGIVAPDLLHTRAAVLYEAGRLEEAIQVAQDAIDARRGLGSIEGDQLSRLSDSLELQANALTRLRRLDEAEALSAEVLAMRARLPWPDRARALLNRSSTLLEAGRPEEGLAAAAELVRGAVAGRSGSGPSDPALADGLTNLAVLLRMNGRWREAKDVQALAVTELRLAVARGGHTAVADLARSLANQSLMHLESGHAADAEAPGREALELREQLAARSPLILAELTDSLNNQAAVLDELGRAAEAEVLASRCVELRRRLQDDQPETHARRLANALGTHCHMLAACGRAEAGVVVGREAVDVLRRLFADDPTNAPWLAHALDSLARASADAGFEAEALELSEEAVAVGSQALSANPGGFGGAQAAILVACAERHAGSSPARARAWVDEALRLLTELSAAEPEAYAVALARAERVRATLARDL
jgi:tetratricopeptide (TPR) repeat protein